MNQCLTSVRNQTLKAIEHLVFDPGSTDDSPKIAKSFPHVTLIEESDNGQSDALNKGFKRARGQIIAWLNSDDQLADAEVFQRVIERFEGADSPDIVYGKGIYVGVDGSLLRDAYINREPGTLPTRLQHEVGILQPAVFVRRTVFEKVGPLREDLEYAMDYDYWIRCLKSGVKLAFLDSVLAHATYHTSNKTFGTRGRSYAEICSLVKQHFGYVHHLWLRRYAEFLSDGHDGILLNSASGGTRNSETLENTFRDLLAAYNLDFDTYQTLEANASMKGYGDTLQKMTAIGVTPTVPARPIPLELNHESNHACYTVGPRRWAFEAGWKNAQIARSHDFLRRQISARDSDVCVIVGNGPSLNRTNLALLNGVDVIISNNAFLSGPLARIAKYFTVVNYLVAEQSSHEINRIKGIHKILPFWLAYCLNPGPDTYFVDAVGHARFSRDMFQNMSWRHTVTFFNLHLAYGLGYRKVVLIGFDHNYKQTPGVEEAEIIHSETPDENHFHPAYFRGKKWQAADVAMMENMYQLAQDAYAEDGRVIVNATVGGHLELFPRIPLEDALELTS